MDLNALFESAEKRVSVQKQPRTLLEILEEQALKSNIRVHPPGNNLRASNFGGCLRALVYKSKGYTEVIDLGTQLTFQQGHAIHAELQKLLVDAGVMESMEEEIEAIPGVPGHYDGITTFNGRELFEAKTVGFGQFERLFRFGVRQVSNKYKIQAHLYMASLNLKRVRFLFVNKNRQCTDEFRAEFPGANQQLLEIIIEFDQDFYQKHVLDKKKAYDEHILNNTMPERKKVGECDYCPFAAHCKTDYEQEKADLKKKAKDMDESKVPTKKAPKSKSSSQKLPK